MTPAFTRNTWKGVMTFVAHCTISAQHGTKTKKKYAIEFKLLSTDFSGNHYKQKFQVLFFFCWLAAVFLLSKT